MKRCVSCKAICENNQYVCNKCGSTEFEPFIENGNTISLSSENKDTYVRKFDRLVSVICVIAGIVSTVGVIVAAIVLKKYWIMALSILCPIITYIAFIV